ncbi:centrosome-associated protein ALMS1 isoform X3 [Sminthopsis crassicaudata]|uniref:centrosome-associated protein ALMS1 isoform X3 n=1 Tax=Sminthopsis crassicaudata TaxID=9301 RepID=UPI003D689704
MEPPVGCPGRGAGERAQGQQEAEEQQRRPGERRPEEAEAEAEQAGAGPPGGERGRMESWQPLKEEVDSTHSLHSSATRLSMRREDSDLSEFPSVEEGMLIICEDDGKEWAEEASCTPFLATEDRSTSFCIPLLESSLTPRVWNETLLQESELEFTPLRGIPDLSEVSEPDSRQPQVMEALCQSSERLSDMGPRRASPQETTRSRNVHFLQQQGKSQSAASPETGGKLLTSYGSDSVQTQASPKSLRRWPTSLPTGQGPSGPTEDGAASLDHRISHAFISPCLETNGLGFSSSLASSLCERYKNLEEYKMKSKLDCLQSDESQVKRLGEVDSPLPKGELSSKFTSHSLCPGASQGQSVQNPPGPHVSSVKFPGHSDSPRTGSSGVTFPSSTHHSVRFKLDDGPKSGPKEGLDANETLAFHEIVASIEPTASKNPTAIQNLLDWKQHISPLSQTEKTSSGQLPQPVYQSTPVVIPAQNFTPQVPLRVIPAPSKVQPPFVSPNEELPQPSPRNLAACKSQTPSQNQDGSSGSSEKTLIDLPFVLPLNQAFSPTLMNILRRDISRGFISQGETSQLRVTFKDHELQTKVVPENDGSAQGPWLDENGIIFSGRVAEMLRDEKYNVSGVPETKEPLQTIPLSSVAPGSCSAYADQFRDGPSEASIPPLTFPQAKLDKSTSTTDNEPESVEPLLVGTELRRYRDRPSQAPPEKEASHCFIDSHPSVPATTSVPVQVEESQSLSPDPLRIFYRSPRFTSNVRSNFNSGASHVTWSIPVELRSHQDLPVFPETSQRPDSREQTLSQIESTPETSSKAEEKSVPPNFSYKGDFKIISKRVQKLIDHWDSRLPDGGAHATPLPVPTSMSVGRDGKEGTVTVSDIKGTPVSVDQDGKKGKVKGKSESEGKTDRGLHTLLVEAESIARKRFSNSPGLHPDLLFPRLSRVDDSRKAPLAKDSMALSQRCVWDDNRIPATTVETHLVNHSTSQRDTGETLVREVASKARGASRQPLRHYDTAQSVPRYEPDRSSVFTGPETSGPGTPLTSSHSSRDSPSARVSYICNPVCDGFFGYLPHIPGHVCMGDLQDRDTTCESDDGCSSEDSLAAHVRHLLRCEPPGCFATQMLRNAEEEECRVRARAWCLKLNLATECGDCMTELNEADLRKVEEIKAGMFGCGKPLDLFQGLPCPVGIRNISETCDHFFIEAHENGCFRPMGNEQFGNSCREFRSNEYAEMSQTQPMASWTTRCGSHAKSVLQTSQAKAWSFSRSGSHQPFLSSTSDESHYASRESPRSLHEEMETKEVESVGPVAVSSREPISLPSRPPSRSCSEAFRHSLCCPSAPVVVQSDRGQSLPAVTWRANRPMSKSPLPISNTILATSIRKDPGLMGNHHDRASGDLSAVTTSLKEKESPAAPAITTTAKPQSSVKESQLLDKQDLARGVSLKSLGIHDKGIRVTAEFPPSISPKEQAEHCQPRSVPPVDNVVGPEHSLRTPLSQHQASPVEREDQLKQKVHSLIVANVEAESSMTVRPNSPTLEGEASPVPSSVLSPKQRAVSYLRITLSPKASNAKLDDEILKKRQHESDSGTRTGLDSLSTSKSRCLVPLEPAPQELAIIPLSDKEEFVNGIYHKTSQPSKSFSRHIQVNIADLDAYSKRVQNTQGRVTSDNLRNASSDTPLKLSSDAVTQITTESPGKTTLSSEIFINSQPHSILKKPSHCPTAQFSLLPYKPPGSAEMYYVPHLTEPLEYPVAKSDTTLESTHSGSNDAIAPEFPPDALGTRDENVCDIVTIKHKEGIYSKKTACKSAWTEEQNPPPEKATESKNHLELENTTHSVFKSAQFYFHHPVHHQHDHDFSCCEPWGRGTCRTHSRRDFFPYTDKDSSFCPPYETSADEHRFLPLRTDVDYSRVERYHWNVMGDRVPRAWQRPEENLQGGSKVSAARETAPRPLEPSLSLSELWNRFQERQKQQKLPESRSSDDLSLVERLDRLAKILQKPMMLSLQASKSARDDHKGESARQQLRRKHQSKRDPSDKSRSPPRSSCRLLGGDPVTLIPAQHSGLDSVSLISSDSRPSPEPAEPASESDVSAQTDGDMGPLEEVSSNVSFAGPARTVQAKTYEASKRQQKPLSERQREGSKKVAKWKKTPPASQVRRRVLQVEYVISSDSFSTTSSAWSSSSSPKEKHNIRMLNKGVQTGELEIVRTTRKHTRDFGVTFPTPKYKATGTRGDSRVNNSSPGSNLEDEKPLTIYMWTKKPRRSKPLCCEGVSWFIPAENPRQAKKENQPGWVPGPGPSWFAPLISSKPWRQPLREKNWQTESSSGRQAEPPGLHQDKETPARFMKAGLQESLERLRPDFISRSRARVKRLRLITEERKLQRLLQKERDQLFNTEEQQKESRDMAGFLSKKGYVTVRNRIITKKEMVQRSKRMYEQLPEVRKRREEEQRKSVYSTYRYRAQLYKMKITNRVLGRKVPWD